MRSDASSPTSRGRAGPRLDRRGQTGYIAPGGGPLQLIINADDFGWTDGHNLAVERAHLHGALSHASLLCNGEAFDGAVALSRRCPGLGVGVHLTLSEGRPLLPPGRVASLLAQDGAFHDSVAPLLRRALSGRLRPEEAEAEWDAQIGRARDAGLHLTHLDSHKHVHLLPPLLDVAVRLARRHGVPYLRLPLEAPRPQTLRRPGWVALSALCLRARGRLRQAGLRHADRFVGFSYSGGVDGQRLRAMVAAGRPGEVLEVMVHPAVVTPAVDGLRRRYGWARRYRFEEELAALCDPALPRRAAPGP